MKQNELVTWSSLAIQMKQNEATAEKYIHASRKNESVGRRLVSLHACHIFFFLYRSAKLSCALVGGG